MADRGLILWGYAATLRTSDHDQSRFVYKDNAGCSFDMDSVCVCTFVRKQSLGIALQASGILATNQLHETCSNSSSPRVRLFHA
jgi:hypothetical protein